MKKLINDELQLDSSDESNYSDDSNKENSQRFCNKLINQCTSMLMIFLTYIINWIS